MLSNYEDVRTLVYLGKDIFRWIGQCLDHMKRSAEVDVRCNAQLFSALIVDSPPVAVREKLASWGVSDRRKVYSRAVGMRCLFEDPPDINLLSPEFLQSYHRFADSAYVRFECLAEHISLDSGRFDFQIYSSQELWRILSDQWQTPEPEDRAAPTLGSGKANQRR